MSEPFEYGGALVTTRGTRFRLFTTKAEPVSLRVFDDRLRPIDTRPMDALGDGVFELVASDLGAGTLYNFVLGEQEVPDPYARFLPHGVHGPAQVMSSHRGRRGTPRPLAEQVIYELHVGTFSPTGTYAGAREFLPALAQLGVTTLELMPLASFAGTRGWGYDGVALFAPYAPYGKPEELRMLIEEAHALGFSVLLDVVYNHFGPAGNYLKSYAPTYFTEGENTPWGESPNYALPAMRALARDNVRYWMEEFGFDGFRFDAVHGIVDRSEVHILREITELARSIGPGVTLIAEDDRNDPAIVEQTGMTGVWADDFHHQLVVQLTGERDGYYAAYEPDLAQLARTIERGWLYEGQTFETSQKPRGKPAASLAAEAFVYCIDNHDQTGNRAFGDRLSARLSPEAYALASSVLLFLPMTPLLFMGQEWAASAPFCFFSDHDAELGQKVSEGRRAEFAHFRAFADEASRAKIPDPQAEATFQRSHLNWDERRVRPHADILALYERLLSLRQRDAVLKNARRDALTASAMGSVLVVRRQHDGEERVLLANFGREPVRMAQLAPEFAQFERLLSTHDAAHEGLMPFEAVILADRKGAAS